MEARALLLIAVLITFVLPLHGDQLPFCQDEIDNVLNHKCFGNGTIGNTPEKPTSLSWKVMDNSMGRVRVEFPLHHERCKEYITTLCLYEKTNLSKDECENLNPSEFRCSTPQNKSLFKVHSYRYLTRINDRAAFKEDPPICKETGTVTFSYVYTGCYIMEVACPAKMDPSINYKAKYIETDYIKEPANYTVHVSFQNYPKKNEWKFFVTGIRVISLVKLELYHDTTFTKEKTCHDFGSPVAVMLMRKKYINYQCPANISTFVGQNCENSLVHLLQGDISVEFGNILEDTGFKVILVYGVEKFPELCYRSGVPHTCCAFMNEEVECKAKAAKKFKPKCYRDDTSIFCLVKNITQGRYCVMVEMYDDRCKAPPESVWEHNKCHYHCLLEDVWNLPLTGVSTVVQPLTTEYIITGCVSSILIILCIALLLYLRMRRTYVRKPGNGLLESSSISSSSKVLEEQWVAAQSREEVPDEVITEGGYENTKG